MKTDRFFVVDIVDKNSRMLMLLFAGITLGTVLAFAYYKLFGQSIGYTLLLVAIYCILFAFYVSFTGYKRKVSKVYILKNYLSFVFAKKHEISSRCDIGYNDIKSYQISPLSYSKDDNFNKDKSSLRVFGFETIIETKDGRTLKFSDSKQDGVLIYSPNYVFRMIDLKRSMPDFPLNLVNFDSKKDVENFSLQFEYYLNTGKNLSLFKNKKYLKCILKYTLGLCLIAIITASIIAYVMYADLKASEIALSLICNTFKILLAIVVPMWLIVALSSFVGGKYNNKVSKIIKTIIEE